MTNKNRFPTHYILQQGSHVSKHPLQASEDGTTDDGEAPNLNIVNNTSLIIALRTRSIDLVDIVVKHMANHSTVSAGTTAYRHTTHGILLVTYCEAQSSLTRGQRRFSILKASPDRVMKRGLEEGRKFTAGYKNKTLHELHRTKQNIIQFICLMRKYFNTGGRITGYIVN